MKTSYNKNLKYSARKLRNDGTKGEAILWKRVLKAKQMEGYQFNRQFLIGNYIVDFICRKLRLIIEIDGTSHIYSSEADLKKQNYLENLGYKILWFTESEVIYRIDDVVSDISYAVECLKGGNPT